MPSRPRTPSYQPKVGEIVHDLAHRTVTGQPSEGVYMATLNGLAYLRPEAGGCEWTTDPVHLRRLNVPRYRAVQRASRPRVNDPSA
ncbi:hypothetical protein [Kitasatospora sp. NPDC047058]|uniref:hypothetical protein n=1 Tax=Kitasatospora sp. NPDC047058 TaxID=3155620 RepID=UPI0033F37770